MRAVLSCEVLEDRLALAASFKNGVLAVTGTNGNDAITITLANGQYTVEGLVIPEHQVRKVTVEAKGGWDAVVIELPTPESRLLRYAKTKDIRGVSRMAFEWKSVALAINRPLADAFFSVAAGNGKAGGIILDIGDAELLRQPVEPEYDEDGDRDEWYTIMEHLLSGGGANARRAKAVGLEAVHS